MTDDELPEGWAQASVTSLIGADGLFSDGDWVESKDQDPNGSIRLLQLADIGDGVFIDKSNRFINEEKFEALRCEEVLEGDVLIARMPDPLGRACLAPKLKQKSITVVDVAILRPGRLSVLPRWLMHSINSPQVRAHIEMESSGTTRKRIARGKLAEMELPIAPLAEQKRIADKLEAVLGRVDACRARLDRVPDLLKRFRQSVLAAATSGQLTEDWREENATNNEWQEAQIQNVANVGTGSTPLRSNAAFFASKGTPWITSAATSLQIVTKAEEFVTEAAIVAHRLKRFPIGTLLVAMYGEGKTRGQVTELGIEATINQACAAVVVNESIVSKRFVKFALEANYLEMRELAEGGNQPNLNLSKIKEFPLRLPSLPEQAEIVRRVEALFAMADRIEARLTAARAQVERLTPATLHKAFRGELVPQDPNDEPASELLVRLKQEPTKSTQRRKIKSSTLPRVRVPKEHAAMTKSRFDDDVKGQPYLANLLRASSKPTNATELFKQSELSIVDFYKQLSWEVEKGFIWHDDKTLEAVS
jgi:type I restriction enzyme S subunit